MSLDELDVAFLGRFDLAISMGLFEKYSPDKVMESKEMLGTIDKI